ncbi:MAG: hypothetical protein ACRC1K_25895 [Planctomycetia bacterium]
MSLVVPWRRASRVEVGWLTAFWIKPPFSHGPLGFGVTAWSFDDALGIIHAFDFGAYLPEDLAGVRVTEGVTIAELEYRHVVANMGPIAIRGMWYPFAALGVPRWADERRANGYT